METSRSSCSSTLFFATVGLWWIFQKYFKCPPPMISSSSKKSTSKPAVGSTTSAEPSVEPLNLPIIDLDLIFQRDSQPERFQTECDKIAQALHEYGCAVVRDPRIKFGLNDTFLDMMERYFALSDGVRDARPEHHYQVGVTPEKIEKARDHCKLMGAYDDANKPISPCPPEKDLKWRFFWRIGPRPESSRFPSLNMEPVVPPEIPEWGSVMDSWGNHLLSSLYSFAEMAAIGFKLSPTAFTSLMNCGPHLLAPTGSDLSKYGNKGHILAGFHYDLNFLTIHGKSRFPGLYVWTRNGQKKQVFVPDGCLLIQAGKQIEYLTGGHVLAGFHEVVINDNTLKVIQKKKEDKKSLWRVSSTLFSNINSDQILEPLEHFKSSETAVAAYPPIYAGEQVERELKAISLFGNEK